MNEHQPNSTNTATDDHDHKQPDTGYRFILALTLTTLILIVEVIGGLWTDSLALLSDAGHVFMDVFALGLSYAALRVAALPPNDRHSYGFHRFKVLAALINGATLLWIAVEIFWEAWSRLQTPEPVLASPMLVVAVIGLVVNLIVALALREHDHDDLNTRSAFLHVVGDALSSVGVIVAGVIILFTGWTWVDPLASVLIAAIILISSWRVLRDAVHILAEGVPGNLTVSLVAKVMEEEPGVNSVHDLHMWTIGPGYLTLSAHVVLADQALSDTQRIMIGLKRVLREQFSIEHTTIQFECEHCSDGAIVCEFPLGAERPPAT
jgi:cobalt-zinc-cadmium efflux system protein